jgi:hypothetical protein
MAWTKPTRITTSANDVKGKLVVGTAKTRRGRRVVPVDILTGDLVREHQRGQDAERAA